MTPPSFQALRRPGAVLLIAAAVACAAAADWPAAQGPSGTNVAPLPPGMTLIDTVSQVQLRWKSDQRIPKTYGTDGRKASARRADGADVGSGYCAPVVADGRVFLFYQRPSGDGVDEAVAQKSLGNGGWGRTTWLVEGDAIVHCFDASSGTTLWKRVFPREGPHIEVAFNKGGGHFLVQVADGRLYVFTHGGQLRCLDPATGAQFWRRDIGPRALSLDLIRLKGLEDRQLQYFNRVLSETPAVSGGVLAMSDGREDTGMRGQGGHGLSGFDAATGALRWYLPGGYGDTPTPWSHEGRHHFLCFGDLGMTLVAADSGQVLWNRADIRAPGPALAIAGTRILANWNDPANAGRGNKERKDTLLCLDLTTQGPRELWRCPGGISHGDHVITERYIYHIDNRIGLRSIDAATGKVLATIPGWNPEYAGLVVTGDLLLGPERKGIRVVRLGPEGSLSPLGMIVLPMATCTRIAVADGQVFVRGETRLSCYDLVKR